MKTIKATLCNGKSVPDEPVNWLDGKRVIVAPAEDSESAGIANDDQPEDPESIARWLAEFEAIPPLTMTPEEESEWQAARKAQKHFDVVLMRDQ